MLLILFFLSGYGGRSIGNNANMGYRWTGKVQFENIPELQMSNLLEYEKFVSMIPD